MAITQIDTQINHDRQAEFKAWMLLHRLTYKEVGRLLGELTGQPLTAGGVLRLVRGERMPVERHRQFVELGVPPELLPRAEDARLGRPCGAVSRLKDGPAETAPSPQTSDNPPPKTGALRRLLGWLGTL